MHLYGRQEVEELHLKRNQDGYFGSALHRSGRLGDDTLHAVVRAGGQVQVIPL